MTRKNSTTRKASNLLIIIGFICVIFLFHEVCDMVAGFFESEPAKRGQLASTINAIARATLYIVVGLYLLSAGAGLAAANPVIGIIFIVVGMAFIWAGWNSWKHRNDTVINPGKVGGL